MSLRFRPSRRPWVINTTAIGAMVAMLALPSSASAQTAPTPAANDAPSVQAVQGTGGLIRTGTTTLQHLRSAAGLAPNPANITGNAPEFSQVPELPDKGTTATPTVVPPPNPAPTVLTSTMTPGFTGFQGISHLDQRLANNGNQFSLEPPDQGLCANTGTILEAVNNALAVYSTTGTVLAPPTALSSFWGLADEVQRTHNPPTFGPFISDPRCYFDPQSQRWFLTELEIDTNPFSGALAFRSAVLIAVSQTSDPTGAYGLFLIDTTDDGSNSTPHHKACPCFGDQPLIGADANGFYITTNEYSLHPFGTTQNDAQMYAVSKQGLADAAVGGPVPALVTIDGGKVLGNPSQSLQPATTPPGGVYAPNREYFMSATDFAGTVGDHRIAVWALTNTSSLAAATPSVSLTKTIIQSEPYAGPPPAVQKAGPRPLGSAVKEPLPKVQSNDDRMQQVVFAQGQLFSALNTGLTGGRVGAAWFIVTPYGSGGKLGAAVSDQGYVALANASVLFPAIAVNGDGTGVMTFSTTGPDLYPSGAYAAIDLGGVSGPVHLSGPGALPEDGFTCYQAFEGALAAAGCRWGDYSAAVAADATHIVMADEYIPNAPRTVNANWSTFIGRLGF